MAPPAEGQGYDLSRRADRVKRLQGFQDHGALLPGVARFAQRVAEGPFDEDGARRLHLLTVLANDRHPDGGDPGLFDRSLDQSHGLIADASGGGQQDQVDAVPAEPVRDLPGRGADQGGDVPAVDMPHEGVVALGQLADDAFLLQFPQPVEG